MISVINFRGYHKDDPLDHVSTGRTYGLEMIVTFIVTIALVYAITVVFNVVSFKSLGVEIAEVLAYTFIAAPIVVALRRSSSLIPYLIVLLPLYAMDLYLQAHVRDHGGVALWMYTQGTFIDTITILPLRFLITLSFDAVLVGPICLWITRELSLAFWGARDPSFNQQKMLRDELFNAKWSGENVASPARDAGFWILRILGFCYLAYFILLMLGSLGTSPWPGQAKSLFDATYSNPFFGVSTFSKIGFMIALAFLGAYNPKMRWYAVLGLLIGHSVSVCSSLFFFFYKYGSHDPFLWQSAALDGGMVILFIWVLVKSSRIKDRFEEEDEFPPDFSIPSMISRTMFSSLGIIALLFIASILFYRIFESHGSGLGAMFGSPDPTLCNTLTMFTVIALLSFMMVKRERLRDYFTEVLLLGFFLTIVASAIWLCVAPVQVITGPSESASVQTWFVFYFLLLILIASIITGVRKMFFNVEYTITTFNPSSSRCVMGVHDSLFTIGKEDPAQVLQAVDRYAGTIRGRKRGLLNFPFWMVEDLFNIIFGLHPPFSCMSVEEQRHFLRKYILRPVQERELSLMPDLADFAYSMGVAAHAVVLFAVYSDVKRHYQIGYIPPFGRNRLQTDPPSSPPPFSAVAPLPDGPKSDENFTSEISGKRLTAPRVSTSVNERQVPDEADYVVIGSGPGGAVMTYRLACETDPARIVLVERGNRNSPHQDFSDREIEMMPKVYKEGGLQQTKRADMFVLQGECVGGGSIINNAVCYTMSDRVRNIWEEKYGLDLSQLSNEYQRVAGELGIGPLDSSGINQKVTEKFVEGIKKFNAGKPSNMQLQTPHVATVNAMDNIGDGLWNIGNKYVKKRSMLETYIPWSEGKSGKADGRHREPPGVTVLSNMTAVKFSSSNRKANAVLLRSGTGELHKVNVRKGIIVAGGVIASSHFLMRSDVNGPVGSHMSCNFAFPAVFEFEDEVKAFDGEQITMGAVDAQDRMIFETYFNPPSAFALSIPYFFDRHTDLMMKYPHLLNFGVLVGSEPNGIISRKADLINGRPFSWNLGKLDQENIKYALTTLLEIGSGANALRAVLPTQPGIEIGLTLPNQIKSGEDSMRYFKDRVSGYKLAMNDLLITTAHPQGGNMMAGDSATDEVKRHRVVDQDFRVVGCDNVFVADASVFPTSININPQWTIMGMSSLASKRVLALT